jgi:hypothetical protein
MKKALAVILSMALLCAALALPLLADPPDNAGKGTQYNNGLWYVAYWVLLDAGAKTGNYWAAAVVSWLLYPEGGPPPWFTPPGH